MSIESHSGLVVTFLANSCRIEIYDDEGRQVNAIHYFRDQTREPICIVPPDELTRQRLKQIADQPIP